MLAMTYLRSRLVLASALCSLLACACSSLPTRVGPRPPESYRMVRLARGDACGVLLFGFIPIGMNSRTERAYADALRNSSGSLIDTRLQYQWWFIPVVGTLHCTVLEGALIE